MILVMAFIIAYLFQTLSLPCLGEQESSTLSIECMVAD